MANKFYVPGRERAEKVGDLFATIAPRYDLINDLQSFGLHRWWKRRLVNLARVSPRNTALDLCCGTGDVAFALARAGARVTGMDFSAPMLEVAAGRNLKFQISNFKFQEDVRRTPDGESPTPAWSQSGESRASGDLAVEKPEFVQGDALRAPFEDEQFDIVTISYGLRNLSDFDGGLREMWRVAKPGGRLLVLDFGKPENAVWRSSYFGYLRWFVPVFGKVFCGDSATHAYILESLKQYPAQQGVAAKMRQLGCRNVKIVNLLGGVMSINYGEKPDGRKGGMPGDRLGIQTAV